MYGCMHSELRLHSLHIIIIIIITQGITSTDVMWAIVVVVVLDTYG